MAGFEIKLARMRQGDAARIEDDATQKMPPVKRKASATCSPLGEGALGPSRRKAGKARSFARQGAPASRDIHDALRRHVSEIVARAGERASVNKEAEAQGAEQGGDLEMGEEHQHALLDDEHFGDGARHLEDFGMWITLQQEAKQRAKMADAVQHVLWSMSEAARARSGSTTKVPS